MATANASPASVPATRRAEAIGHVCSTARRAANAESQSNLRIAMHLPYAPARVSYLFSRRWRVVNQPEVLDGAFWNRYFGINRIAAIGWMPARQVRVVEWIVGADAQLSSPPRPVVEILI